ncbi:MAG: recombinase family protein [Ruminococcus sp.]|nr:recombinase family protein [Ruminococcus sp.]
MRGYCMYLRKSRADIEAESRGEGETLSRHHAMLAELAERQELNIEQIYKEIVSGDSIAARPQMQALLADVSDGRYAGVLVVEIERLARGDTIDQGIVAQAFRESSTKIITPSKTYDPDNEFDEEYFEFSLFMSRREYKTIKRRMQNGRLASVKEGNYIGSAAPYGYRKTNPEPKVHTLEMILSESETVKLIYKLYLDGMGTKSIADELNRIGISPQKKRLWESPSIKKILSNPVYCGKVGWKTRSNGDTLYNGIHEPVISEEIFRSVQEKKRSCPAVQLRTNDRLLNYYHNVLFCKNCGHQMKRRFTAKSGSEHILCVYNECKGKTVSSAFEAVDEAVIAALRYRVKLLERLKWEGNEKSSDEPDEKALLNAELERAKKQKERLYDLLEQEVYDINLFRERSEIITEKIKKAETALKELESVREPEKPQSGEAVQSIESILERFSDAGPEEKNRLLRAVFRKIYYSKNKRTYRNRPYSDLELTAEFI